MAKSIMPYLNWNIINKMWTSSSSLQGDIGRHQVELVHIKNVEVFISITLANHLLVGWVLNNKMIGKETYGKRWYSCESTNWHEVNMKLRNKENIL